VIIATSLLALSLLATPQPLCPSAAHTGTFRFTAVAAPGSDAGASKAGIIVLENIYGWLEATLVTDDGAPSVIESLSLHGDTLDGSVRTKSGVAKVQLRIEQKSVAGSITKGKRVWSVTGRQTSGDVPEPVNGAVNAVASGRSPR